MKLKNLGFILVFILVSGCSAVGKFNDSVAYKEGTYVSQEKMDRLIVAQTTEEQAIAIVGHPGNKESVGTRIIWQYRYVHLGYIPFGEGQKKTETTVLEFEHGVLAAAYKSGGVSSSNPLLNAAGLKQE